MAAMVYGLAPVPPSIAKEISWADQFVLGEDPSELVNPMEELALFALFHSPLVPLSADTLIQRLEVCFHTTSSQSGFCQEQLIRTLSLTGHHERAGELLRQIPERLRKRELDDYLALNRALSESRY